MSAAIDVADRLTHIWETPKTAREWFSTVDHKEIGRCYLVTVMAFLIIGGIEALIIRLQLFALGFLAIVVVGLNGIVTEVIPIDWQITDTYFVVSHLHYALIGANVFPVFNDGGGRRCLCLWFLDSNARDIRGGRVNDNKIRSFRNVRHFFALRFDCPRVSYLPHGSRAPGQI